MKPTNPHFRIGSLFYRVIGESVYIWNNDHWTLSGLDRVDLMWSEGLVMCWPEMGDCH
jgi:hypothetical protein